MDNPDGIARLCRLPNDEFDPAWTSIKLANGVHDRLLAQSLLSFIIRQKLPFEAAPLHGLILLKGPPGTGKTTLGRGLANQVAKQLPGTKCTFIEVDPHALISSALGRSQQAVAKLFEQTIPELAMDGAALVLIDELETLAVSRHQLSLEANPVDVHRATDAALAGLSPIGILARPELSGPANRTACRRASSSLGLKPETGELRKKTGPRSFPNRDREQREVRQLRQVRRQVLSAPGSTKIRFNRPDPAPRPRIRPRVPYSSPSWAPATATSSSDRKPAKPPRRRL